MAETKYAVIICDPPNKYILGRQWGHRTVVEVLAYEGAERPEPGTLSVASLVLHTVELKQIKRRARLKGKGFWSVEALEAKQMAIAEKARQVDAVDSSLAVRKQELNAIDSALVAKQQELDAMAARLETKTREHAKASTKLKRAKADLAKADLVKARKE